MEIDERFACKGKPIRNASQMPRILECDEIKEEWQSSINKDCWWSSGYTGPDTGGVKEKEIIKKCLSFGGCEVCMPVYEEDADAILTRGQLWYGDNIRMMKGRESKCHQNSAEIWFNNRGRKLDNAYRCEVALATGYALSKDGMWRQHSWCVLRTPRTTKIVETTLERIAYFGFVMNENEAMRFAYEND